MLTRKPSAPGRASRSPARSRTGIGLITQFGARELSRSLALPRQRQRRLRKTASQTAYRAEELKIIQVQVGHECDSSTAVYTHVSDDYMNTALRRALAPALDRSDRS